MNDTPSSHEVLKTHLQLSRSNSEQDVLTCYRDDSFVITAGGVHRELDAIRACYRQLAPQLPNARFTDALVTVEQDIGFVEWSADSDTHEVRDGADSYIIPERLHPSADDSFHRHPERRGSRRDARGSPAGRGLTLLQGEGLRLS